jgi:hypothetical protein
LFFRKILIKQRTLNVYDQKTIISLLCETIPADENFEIFDLRNCNILSKNKLNEMYPIITEAYFEFLFQVKIKN